MTYIHDSKVLSSISSTKKVIDVSTIRRTIRLIHCLQKERGATCGASASSFALKSLEISLKSSDENKFNKKLSMIQQNTKVMLETMENARLYTDAAMSELLLYSRDNNSQSSINTASSSKKDSVTTKGGFHYGAEVLPLHESLLRVRSLMNDSSCNKTNTPKPKTGNSIARIHRRIFAAFNILISNIINDQIVLPYSSMLKEQDQNQHLLDRSLCELGSNRVRTKSMMDDKLMKQMKKKEDSKLKLFKIDDDEDDDDNMGRGLTRSKSDERINYNLCENTEQKEKDIDGNFIEQNDTSKKYNTRYSLDSRSSQNSNDKKQTYKPSKATCSLLIVLLAFVRLKESSGIERASLSILLSLSSSIDKENVGKEEERLVNDLVLEIENQRHLVFELRQKVQKLTSLNDNFDEQETNYKFLVSLVEQSVTLSPELMILHNLISRDFDLIAFRDAVTTPESFWKVISLFIDRLHTLELLIIEEIGSSVVFGSGYQEKDNASLYSNAVNDISSEISTPIQDNCDTFQQSNTKSDLDLISIAFGASENVTTEQQIEARNKLRSFSPDYLKTCIESVFQEEEKQTVDIKETSRQQQETQSNQSKKLLKRRETCPVILPSEEDEHSSNNSKKDKDWMIDLYEIKFLKRVGRGIAGTTYLGKWQDKEVAIKVAATSEIGLTGWEAEVKILRQLHHPNIIQLLGSVVNKTPQTNCLVLEYCNGGDLTNAMNNPTPGNFFFFVVKSIVNGMVFLHRKEMLHR